MSKVVAVGLAGDAQVTLTADIKVPEGLPQNLRAEAQNRVQFVLQREAQRLAEIALVDARDAQAEPAERERIRKADPNRGHVVVGAGTRAAVESGKVPVSDAVQVLKGSIEAHGETLTAKEAK